MVKWAAMRVFQTGASGFIASHLVPELIGAGHRVIGLCRSDKGAAAFARVGAEAVRGDVDDLRLVRAAANAADGVIHAAFDHNPADPHRAAERDRRVVAALADSDRPLVVSSDTRLVRSRDGGHAAEADPHLASAEHPRAATEEAADALIERGGRVVVLRLSQVHDSRRKGRITWRVDLVLQLCFTSGRAESLGTST